MKYICLNIFFLFFFFLSGYSQEYDPYTYQDIKPKRNISDNIFFGGGLGMQFGTFTVIKFTPEFGVRPSDMLETGIGAYYMFSKNFNYDFSDHVYGGNVFSRLYVTQNLFIKGEYEILNIADFDYTTGYYTGNRIYIPGLLGGIGYRQKIGERSALLTSILYNFTITEKTPYRNPIIKVSFIF